MTRLEVIKENKKAYARLAEAVNGMSGLERLVAECIMLPRLKSNNWAGGMSDAQWQKIVDTKIAPCGYSVDAISEEFDKQVKLFG